VFYILKDTKDAARFKIGESKNVRVRIKELNPQFKTTWELVSAYKTTKEIAEDVEKKLLMYFSTSEDQGETTKHPMFVDVIKYCESREFIEELLLEM
jgi:hypothetical protein